MTDVTPCHNCPVARAADTYARIIGAYHTEQVSLQEVDAARDYLDALVADALKGDATDHLRERG
ncbi:hypothetical protein [Pararhodospirillum photometricum]|nr:hypothetical protein [Pararhodospirillum photometricum]